MRETFSLFYLASPAPKIWPEYTLDFVEGSSRFAHARNSQLNRVLGGGHFDGHLPVIAAAPAIESGC